MLDIRLNTDSLSVKGEDLTPFQKIADAINKLGKNIEFYVMTGDNPKTKASVHVFKNPKVYLAGDMFIVEEVTGSKEYVKCLRLYMSLFNGYEVSNNCIKMRKCIDDAVLYFKNNK